MATFEQAVFVEGTQVQPSADWNTWLNTVDPEQHVSPRANTVYGIGIEIGKLAYRNGDTHQQPEQIAGRFEAVTKPPFEGGESASLLSGIQEGVSRAATARNYPGGNA